MFRAISQTNLFLLGVLVVIAGCQGESTSPESSVVTLAAPEFTVDSRLNPKIATLDGFEGSDPRPVVVAEWPDGTTSQFVANELIISEASESEIAAFVEKYNATILRDNKIIRIPGATARELPADYPGDPVLLRVDLSRIAASQFSEAMLRANIGGEFTFSSSDAAKLLALVASESDLSLSPNFVAIEHNSKEHPDGTGSFINTNDTTLFWHLSDPNIGTNVTRAWEYLRYLCLPLCDDGQWEPAIVALIDRGYNLDPVTGVPLAEGGPDYFFTGSIPMQIDVVDYDVSAGAMGGNFSWHGQQVFGACCAKPRNQYGGAGTGGDVVRPLLIRHSGSYFEIADGIKAAALNGADVVSISFGGFCGWYCKTIFYDPHGWLELAISLANSLGVAVVASAGNDADDLTGGDRFVCTLRHVICVGSINRNKNNVNNYGTPVHIWAPTEFLSTVDPISAAIDTSNDVGADEVRMFSGTSASTPFVAGIIGLLKAIDKNQADNFLNCDLLCMHEQYINLLQSTANMSSTDAIVAKGYVDALAAVMQLRPNAPPDVSISRPNNGENRSWNGVSLFAVVTDPEPGHVLPMFKDDYAVTFVSDLEGELCTATIAVQFIDNAPLPEVRCRTTFAQLGTHQIVATATDPFGATATANLTLNVTNGGPSVSILQPSSGATFNTQEAIQFFANVSDPDSAIDASKIVWKIGATTIGNGGAINTTLPAGDQTITIEVEDQFGETDQDSITIFVAQGDSFPFVEITEPANVSFLNPMTPITFTANAVDAEDGEIVGSSIVWTSSRDGNLGTGSSITTTLNGPSQACNPDSVGHVITAQATDSDGNTNSDSLNISVGQIC